MSKIDRYKKKNKNAFKELRKNANKKDKENRIKFFEKRKAKEVKPENKNGTAD